MALKQLHALDTDEVSASKLDLNIDFRTQIARELHDTVAQDIRVALMVMEIRERGLVGRDPESQEIDPTLLLRQALTNLQRIIESSRAGSRINDLRAALSNYLAHSFLNGLMPLIRQRGTVYKLEQNVSNEVYRIAVEAIRNASQHAHDANRVCVDLYWCSSSLQLTVSDDGMRFAPSPRQQHLGLIGMRERAALIGGALDIASSVRGTRVMLVLPRCSGKS